MSGLQSQIWIQAADVATSIATPQGNFVGFAVTGVFGTFLGHSILGIAGPGGRYVSPGANSFDQDNAFFLHDGDGVKSSTANSTAASTDGIDNAGISFTTSAGTYNLYTKDGSFYYTSAYGAGTQTSSYSPASLASFFGSTNQGASISLATETAPTNVLGTGYNDMITANGAFGADTIDGGGGGDTLDAGMLGGSGAVLVDLFDGLISRGGQIDAFVKNVPSVLLGSEDTTAIGLASGSTSITGGAGALDFYSRGSNDVIDAGTGNANVVGGSGNLVFTGGGGTNAIKGGTASNFIQGGPTEASKDMFYSSGGNDFAYGGAGALTVIGGTGNTFVGGGSGITTLIGSNQAASATNVLQGGEGTDVFYAGIGVNLLFESDGTDVLAGNAGTDYVYGGSGRSFVYGGSGTDVVTTGAGNQYVQAGSGFTFFNDTAANLHANRFDQIDNFAGGKGTNIYMPAAVQGATSFVAQNGGTAVLTAVKGGTAEIFASGADITTVQSHTHFTL